MTPHSSFKQQQQMPQSFIPLWKKNIWMDLYIFINPHDKFNDYSAIPNWKISLQNNNVREDIELKKHMDLLLPVSTRLF